MGKMVLVWGKGAIPFLMRLFCFCFFLAGTFVEDKKFCESGCNRLKAVVNCGYAQI